MTDDMFIERIPDGEPRAFVDRDWMGRIKVHLATRTHDGRVHVLHADGTIRAYSPDETATTEPLADPFLTIPAELANALLDALAGYFGGVSEVRQLRKDYEAERARVDRFIAHLTGGPR